MLAGLDELDGLVGRDGVVDGLDRWVRHLIGGSVSAGLGLGLQRVALLDILGGAFEMGDRAEVARQPLTVATGPDHGGAALELPHQAGQCRAFGRPIGQPEVAHVPDGLVQAVAVR